MSDYSALNGGKSPDKKESEQADTSNGSEYSMHSTRSEFEARASDARNRVEQKLSEIEAKIRLKEQEMSEMEELEDSCELSEVIEKKRLTDVKRARSYSLAEMKDTAVAHLWEELDKAQKELKLKDEEVLRLSKIRDEVGAEIEDLTASLFEEANNMINEANLKRTAAEKEAREANMKLNILQDEVSALKALIKSAMPFIPSYVSSESHSPHTPTKRSLFKKGGMQCKSPSCSDLQLETQASEHLSTEVNCTTKIQREVSEPDPVLHKEFVAWRQNPVIDKSDPFLKRIYSEDIAPCMNFENKELADKVLSSIEANRIIVESIPDKGPLPKMCALLKAPRFCRYRMNLGDDGMDYYISSLSRNRIAAICDLFSYLRYIEKGLVKQSVHEVYREVLKKRKAISVARLGLPDGCASSS